MTRPTLPSRLRTLGPPAPEPAEIRQLRADLARKTKLVEDTLLSLDNLVSPLDWPDAGFGGSGSWRWARPVDRTMDRTHAPLNYLNEQEWRWALAQARDLVQRNHLALGFRDHVSHFIGPVDVSFVLRGQSPGATASGPADADGTGPASVDPLVRACTQVWDEWREWSDWGQGCHDREAECRRRLIVEGECTLRFFAGDAGSEGLPYVRHVEPELIRTPPGHSPEDRYGWGVITGDEDDEDEQGLWVCHPQNVSAGREVPASEYVRIKGNVDRTVKRGWSDFNPVGEQLRKLMGLLDNVAHVARLQAAIAWWEEFPTATMQQVSSLILAGQDYARTKLPPNASGADQSVTNYEAGTVVRTEGGREVKPGPVSEPGGFAQVEQMVLRGIGFRWGCPSYFSGGADTTFASVLVTGSPFVRITESRQEEVKGFARRVACRVLEFAERTGRLPRGASRRVRAVATARPVVMADEEKQARTFLSLYEKNCADPVEFIRKRGGDPKVVAANIAAWQKKFAPPQPGEGGAPGGGLPPSGPTPAPPGSAGGDGSSPNAGPVGEAVGVASEELTEARAKRQNDQTWSVGKNRYTKVDGKIRKVYDKSDKKTPQNKSTPKDKKTPKGNDPAQGKKAGAGNKAGKNSNAQKKKGQRKSNTPQKDTSAKVRGAHAGYEELAGRLHNEGVLPRDAPGHAQLRQLYEREAQAHGDAAAEQSVRASLAETARLQQVFQQAHDPVDITHQLQSRFGDLRGLHENWNVRDVYDASTGTYRTRGEAFVQQVVDAGILPRQDRATGVQPLGILITPEGRAYGVRAGHPETAKPFSPVADVSFGAVVPQSVGRSAGAPWDKFLNGGHLEGGVAAFMRKAGITEGTLLINLARPCPGAAGCGAQLPKMLSPGSTLNVIGTTPHGIFFPAEGRPDEPS